MRSRRKSANTGKLGRRARQGVRCVVGLCLLVLTGCAGSTNQHAKGDPLVGDIHPPGNGPAHAGSGPSGPAPGGAAPNPPAHTQNPGFPPPATTQNPGMPPIPQTQGPATNAALASRPGSRRLAIGDRPPPNSGGQPANFLAPNGNRSGGSPKVVALPRDNVFPAVATTGSVTASQQTVDVLQAQLRSRGVLFQKQDTAPDGVKFSCLVPNPTNPDNVQLYEATARDYVTAVQAVIVQIDQQRK